MTVRESLVRLRRALAVYAAASVALVALVGALVAEAFAARDVPEGGVVESLQAVILLCAAVSWFFEAAAAKKDGAGPEKAFLLVGFATLAMFVRELDRVFDVALWHGAWAAVDVVVIAVCFAALGRQWRRSVSDVASFAGSPRGWMVFSAVFSAVVFSQALGWKGVWHSVFDNELWLQVKDRIEVYDQDLERHVKNVVEESLELFSYAMLLASTAVPRALAGKRRKD